MAKKKKEREPLLRSSYEIHLEDFTDQECKEWLRAMFYYKKEWRILENISSGVKATIRQQITEWENDKEEYQKVCDRNRERVMKRRDKGIQNNTTVYHSIPQYTTDTNSNSNITSISIDTNTSNKKENLIKEKKKKDIPSVSELVREYENTPLLKNKINDTRVVRMRAEYKQRKKDRAYKTIDWFIQQLAVMVKTIENWLPRPDISSRLEFAINQASENERKWIVWNDRIENDYTSFKSFKTKSWTTTQ